MPFLPQDELLVRAGGARDGARLVGRGGRRQAELAAAVFTPGRAGTLQPDL